MKSALAIRSGSFPDIVEAPRVATHSSAYDERPTWHRVRAVCQRKRISARAIARLWNVEVAEVERQLQETTNLSLKELFRWQALLDVPLADLLTEEVELGPTDWLSS